MTSLPFNALPLIVDYSGCHEASIPHSVFRKMWLCAPECQVSMPGNEKGVTEHDGRGAGANAKVWRDAQ